MRYLKTSLKTRSFEAGLVSDWALQPLNFRFTPPIWQGNHQGRCGCSREFCRVVRTRQLRADLQASVATMYPRIEGLNYNTCTHLDVASQPQPLTFRYVPALDSPVSLHNFFFFFFSLLTCFISFQLCSTAYIDQTAHINQVSFLGGETSKTPLYHFIFYHNP